MRGVDACRVMGVAYRGPERRRQTSPGSSQHRIVPGGNILNKRTDKDRCFFLRCYRNPRNHYNRTDLFALVPQLGLRFEPQLEQLDRLLDDDEIFDRVRDDLARRYPRTRSRGRPSTPVEVILRMLVVMRLYGWSYEQAEYFVNDSLVLRQFCRVYLEKVPDDTTLIRWANTIGPETAAGAQRPRRPAGPVAEGDPRPQAPRRHHGGRDRHPLPHRQRPDRRRRAGRLAAAAAGQGGARRGGRRAGGGVPQPGPHRPQAVPAAAPDRPPQGRAGPRGVEGGLRPADRHGQAHRGPGRAGAGGPAGAGATTRGRGGWPSGSGRSCRG